MGEKVAPKTEGAWIAPSAVVMGDVVLEPACSVWYGAVIRGDAGPIRVGAGTNIQDNCVLHSGNQVKLTLGRNCTVGHGAIVHGCTVGDCCLIGMGAIVLDGARLGDHCLVGAGALVTGKMDAPAGSLLLGSPAKVVRSLTEAERRHLEDNAAEYRAIAPKELA